jgi:C_GCAxxG_C_C family probable redox protein
LSDVEQTVACFKKGFNCAQAVLSTYGPRFGLDRGLALKVAAAFGGGMGSMGETCGAVTGAFMVIGLTQASRERTDELVREFAERFKSRHRSTVCRELLGCDIGTSEGFKTAEKEKHFKKLCPSFVRDAADILEEIV